MRSVAANSPTPYIAGSVTFCSEKFSAGSRTKHYSDLASDSGCESMEEEVGFLITNASRFLCKSQVFLKLLEFHFDLRRLD